MAHWSLPIGRRPPGVRSLSPILFRCLHFPAPLCPYQPLPSFPHFPRESTDGSDAITCTTNACTPTGPGRKPQKPGKGNASQSWFWLVGQPGRLDLRMTFNARQTRITTMKTISRRIIRVLLTLCVLGLIATRAGQMTPRIRRHRQAQARPTTMTGTHDKSRPSGTEGGQARSTGTRRLSTSSKSRLRRIATSGTARQLQVQRDRDQAERDQKEPQRVGEYQWQVHRDSETEHSGRNRTGEAAAR